MDIKKLPLRDRLDYNKDERVLENLKKWQKTWSSVSLKNGEKIKRSPEKSILSRNYECKVCTLQKPGKSRISAVGCLQEQPSSFLTRNRLIVTPQTQKCRFGRRQAQLTTSEQS